MSFLYTWEFIHGTPRVVPDLALINAGPAVFQGALAAMSPPLLITGPPPTKTPFWKTLKLIENKHGVKTAMNYN